MVERERYCDTNWITDSKNWKSTSEYVFTPDKAVVSWKFSKQTFITRSTMEVEFIVLDTAWKEVEWLRNFLKDIPNWWKLIAPICIYYDSQSAFGSA